MVDCSEVNMKLNLMTIVLTFYFLAGMVMVAFGQIIIDNMPLAMAGYVTSGFSITVIIAINIKHRRMKRGNKMKQIDRSDPVIFYSNREIPTSVLITW